LLGQTANNEMVPSIYAKHLFQCLGTVQAEPVAVGTSGNALEMISFSGRTLPTISPTQLKQLLTGSATDPVVKLRAMRDTTLNQLNAIFKADGTPEQKTFLDAMASSQQQVRELSQSLSTTLASITTNDVHGQALAAAALIAAKVAPVITLHIPFGGDNHSDQDLATESAQHVTGVQGIQAVMDALSMLQLTDKVTFATLNVFGRNLNSISKTESRAGRDHYGNHSVMMMTGKNIKPSVIGGITGTALQASPIDSATGLASASGDIPAAQTHVAAARTLGVALGIPTATLNSAFISTAGGKAVNAALNGVSA
jgi:hypothetical protein